MSSASIKLPVSANDYAWVPQQCPVCRSGRKKFVGYRGGEAHRQGLGVRCAIFRCAGCGLIFPDPMPIPRHGMEQHYNLNTEEYFYFHDQQAKCAGAELALRTAASLIGGKGRLLDVGAGRGELLRAARESGWEALGIEPSPAFAVEAERYSGSPVLRTPLDECNFPPGSFDVVILAAVLEHLYHPDETLAVVARILRKGGALFLDVPNEAGLYFKVGNLYERMRFSRRTVNLAPTFSPYHVFGFTPKSLRMLLASNKLEPRIWRVYAGTSALPRRKGLFGAIEHLGARAATMVSNFGALGTYIETWAIKTSAEEAH
jgi:SAM-dependent methyltransferase